MAFWDASAFIPLFITQPNSAKYLAYSNEFAMAVWWGSLVEAHSALARLRRLYEVNEEQLNIALTRLSLYENGWYEITPDPIIRKQAQVLLY